MIYEFKQDNFTTIEELMIKVREIHKQLFPKATIESQCAKFEEEFKESTEANGPDFMKELADMFIVACGIGNFNRPISDFLCGYIINKVGANKQKDILLPMLIMFICDKMNKNQERKWNETSEGYYKHKILN